ncbi:MAG: peptidase [Ignavibacteriae bacterium]|nr:MAG: peptidase [Ignavibacteriota bacterium]
MKKIKFLIIACGLLVETVFAQDFDKSKLDNYFEVLEKNNKFMGSIAVSRNGKLLYTKSVGYSDIEKKAKADNSTKYRIGSVSKTFTTVLILKAVEEGKLNLNQTIDKYFPKIKNADKITIQHLLSHRSGIHNFTDDKNYLTWNTKPKTESEMINIIAKCGSDFEPDSKAVYSNSNFVLLTYLIEKVLNESYSNLLKKYIIKPLELKDTYFGGKIDTNNSESKSYLFRRGWELQPETDISIPLGAGGIVSTPSDLIKFSNALFKGKLLKDESLKLMKTIKDKYGLGLFQIPFYDKIGFGHTGGIDGFTSILVYFPDSNISYALTSNGSNINNNDVHIAVLSAVYNKPYDIPSFISYNVNSEDLDKYLGIYSSKQIPLKITITQEGNVLIAQATGQSSFPLEATAKNKFKFDQAGVILEFNPSKNKMILKQGGGIFEFEKN